MKAKLTQRMIIVLSALLLFSAACAVPAEIQSLLEQQQQVTLPADSPDDFVEIATQVLAQAATSTEAPLPATLTATPTRTLFPSSTPVPTATTFRMPPTTICDYSSYVSDVTIPDGSQMPAGTKFVKTWKIKNNGRCTWSTDYTIVTTKGNSMGYTTTKLSSSVAPGDTIEISVNLTSPSSSGTYRTFFQLANKRGTVFSGRFYVDIKVVTLATNVPDPNVVYEFANRYCDATWNGNSKTLACPSAGSSSDGFMSLLPNPVLETGYIDNEPGLLTVLPGSTDSVITGKYPSINIQPGYHFASILGCERNADGCNVKFELGYNNGSGSVIPLATWNESYDNKINQVDVDLSFLAGQNVVFYLTVYSNGTSTNDRALWLRPRIVKTP